MAKPSLEWEKSLFESENLHFKKDKIMYRGHEAKNHRREQAELLAVERRHRTPGEQLALLDERPGNSTKERIRLLKQQKDNNG